MVANVAVMQQQQLPPPPPPQQRSRGDSIECWDDDPDFADIVDIPTTHCSSNSASATASVSIMGSPTFSRTSDFQNRRESLCSSRMSMTSAFDLDGMEMDEHELPLDDSPAAAIASAIRAGIPIPENVPSSALVGGTIKRLGNNKKSRKIAAHDDWSEDLELPTVVNNLSVKRTEFPDALDEIMDGRRSGVVSPFKMNLIPSASSQLNKFRDEPEDDDFMKDFDDIASSRLVSRSALPSPPSSEAPRDLRSMDEDFDADFEFPADAPLRLNINTIDNNRFGAMDAGFDDWGELDSGIGGSYCGGSRLGGSTNGDRLHSVAGLLSPTMTAMTMESEDEMLLDGLILPDGGLPDLNTVLEKRKRQVMSPGREEPPFRIQRDSDVEREDDGFFDGIEIGDGELFDAHKLTLNRNVKQKQEPRKKSPTRRTAMSLTFTTNTEKLNTPKASSTRNRLSNGPVLLPSSLEPVAERDNPPPTVKKIAPSATRNRWSGNNGTASTTMPDLANIPPPPAIAGSRLEKNLGKKTSARGLPKNENTAPTTTSAQLLRAKRSMQNISKVTGGTNAASQKSTRQKIQPPTRTQSARPSSRTSNGRPPSSNANSAGRPTSTGSRPPSSGANNRPASRSSIGRPPSRETQSSIRPKTPHANNNKIGLRHPAPFLPAGSSVRTSHHVTLKSSRQTLGPEERPAVDKRPASRIQQRSGMTPRHSPSSSGASNTTTTKKLTASSTPLVAPEHLRREAASTMTQPTRKRYFGDGTELEAFDDLPTSSKQENRFTVTPVAKGAPRSVRPKSLTVPREEQPKKRIDRFGRQSQSQSDVPSYLRDTAASRNAREITQQRLGMTTPAPPSPPTDRWRNQVAQRNSVTPRASKRKTQTKPHLIKPMGSINAIPKEAATNGMTYNPRTMRWDGNEKALAAFDLPTTSTAAHTTPSTTTLTSTRTPTRAPALITKVPTTNSTPVVQVVGGMVFDPSRMCWLKVDEDPDDDELDPFEGVEDIPADDIMSTDTQSVAAAFPGCGGSGVSGGGGTGGGNNSIIMGGTSSFGGLAGGPPRLSGGFGEFVVGEEFDVGPMFVGRQKEEEERWRGKVEGWVVDDEGGGWSGGGLVERGYLLRELLTDPAFAVMVMHQRR